MGKGGVYGGATVLLNGRAAWHFFVHARSLKAQVIPLIKLVMPCSPGGTKLNVQVQTMKDHP